MGHSTDEDYVLKGFWSFIQSSAIRIPFSKDAVAMWYCATDPTTPGYVKLILFSALSYLIFPIDEIPDAIPVIGLMDDATVISTALVMCRMHIKQEHHENARKALGA